jgi:acetyl esterase/lipase
MPVRAGDEEMSDRVTVHHGIAYANHDGVELAGDLYLPKAADTDTKATPALVAVHGGGWVTGVRAAFQYWGPYLATRGIAIFAISYRLTTKSKTFPEAVQDVLAGVQFVRGKAAAFGIDPTRIGLIGASAGAHLAALAALSGRKFVGAYPHDPFAAADTSVKALIGIYGVYDLYAMWSSLQVQDGRNSTTKSKNSSARRRWRTARFISMPRRSAMPPIRTMRSAFSSPLAPMTISSIQKVRPNRFSSRSNRPVFLCGRASCPARHITG